LRSDGFGKMWGFSRSWTNGTGYAATSFYGNGMVVSQLPYLRQDPTHIVLISDGTTARYWDIVTINGGDGYRARFYLQEGLTFDQSTGGIFASPLISNAWFNHRGLTIGAVRRLQVAYDTGGRPYLYTSYDAATGGNVVNQVQHAYNGLSQLVTEYQSHAGLVN